MFVSGEMVVSGGMVVAVSRRPSSSSPAMTTGSVNCWSVSSGWDDETAAVPIQLAARAGEIRNWSA